jgi:protein TonB
MKISTSYIMLLGVFLSASISLLSAQTSLDEAVRKADVPPAWPGCEPKMSECTKSRMADFIAANLQIPPEAKAQGAGGVVVMEFVVEKTGSIGEIKPLHDPGLGLGAEAIRIITLMKTKKIKWIPAEEDGKRIAFRYTVPVSFNVPMVPKEKTMAPVPTEDPSHIYDIVEIMPRFAGCEEVVTDSVDCTFTKVVSYLKTNLKYPEAALKNKIHGQVVAEFIVDKTGMITELKIKQGIGFGCDEETLRLIKAMPAWSPGLQYGLPVNVRMKLPVVFQMPKEKPKE